MMDHKQPLQWIANAQSKLIETLIEWSNINSGSYHAAGVAEQAQHLKALYAGLADSVETHAMAPHETVNGRGELDSSPVGPLLHMKKRPHAPKQILLCGHLDTVFTPEEQFAARRDGNILHGPGVADMKGGLLVMYAALRALEESPLCENLGWEVVLNPDEEIGSYSSIEFLKKAAKDKDFGLIFEPALDDFGNCAGDRKGSGKITLVMRGVSAHAGRDFHKGANAIIAMSALLHEIHALNGQKEGLTINVGEIRGGTAINIVPDLAVARLDVRYEQPEHAIWLKAEIHKKLAVFQSHDKHSVEYYEHFERVPKPLVAGNQKLMEQIISLGKRLNQNFTHHPTGGVCDGNILWDAGLPNVDSLGVYGGHLHSHREYMLVDSLQARAELTALILLTYAAGEWSL